VCKPSTASFGNALQNPIPLFALLVTHFSWRKRAENEKFEEKAHTETIYRKCQHFQHPISVFNISNHFACQGLAGTEEWHISA